MLNAYCVPDAAKKTIFIQSNLTLITNLKGAFYRHHYHHSHLQIRKLKHREVKLLTQLHCK